MLHREAFFRWGQLHVAGWLLELDQLVILLEFWKKPSNFAEPWIFAPRSCAVGSVSTRHFWPTPVSLCESGGKWGQLLFECVWVGHFGNFNWKIRPIYDAPAAARCCTQQSVHEYAMHEYWTLRGAHGGVQVRPTARFVPFCPVSYKKRSLTAKTNGTF